MIARRLHIVPMPCHIDSLVWFELFVSCEYIQSTHRLALLCQSPRATHRSTCTTPTRTSLQGRTLWIKPAHRRQHRLPLIKNLEARLMKSENNVNIVVCARCVTDAASPYVVRSNLFIAFVALKIYCCHLCLSRDLPSSVTGVGRCGVSVNWIGAPHWPYRGSTPRH